MVFFLNLAGNIVLLGRKGVDGVVNAEIERQAAIQVINAYIHTLKRCCRYFEAEKYTYYYARKP